MGLTLSKIPRKFEPSSLDETKLLNFPSSPPSYKDTWGLSFCPGFLLSNLYHQGTPPGGPEERNPLKTPKWLSDSPYISVKSVQPTTAPVKPRKKNAPDTQGDYGAPSTPARPYVRCIPLPDMPPSPWIQGIGFAGQSDPRGTFPRKPQTGRGERETTGLNSYSEPLPVASPGGADPRPHLYYVGSRGGDQRGTDTSRSRGRDHHSQTMNSMYNQNPRVHSQRLAGPDRILSPMTPLINTVSLPVVPLQVLPPDEWEQSSSSRSHGRNRGSTGDRGRESGGSRREKRFQRE